jgi:mutator protein MutT
MKTQESLSLSFPDRGSRLTHTLGSSALVTVRLAITDPSTGKLLVAQRTKGSNARTANAWEFPGGKVDAGETLAQAASRETREELGVETEITTGFVPYNSYLIKDGKYAGRHIVAYVAQAQYVAGEPRPISETQAVDWLTYDEIRTSPLFRSDTTKLLESLQPTALR